MSREHEGPFWVARSLELAVPEEDYTIHHHLGSTAAIALRNAWRTFRWQQSFSVFESPLIRFGCSSVVIVHQAEIAAAVRDEETGATDSKLFKAVKKELEQYIPECNKPQFQDSAPADEQPTQPISTPFGVSADMFGGVQVAPRDGNVHFIARLDDPEPQIDQEEPTFQSLHAERENLLSIIHEVTGYGPTAEEGVGIAIGSIKADDAAVKIPYYGAHRPASQLLQIDIARGILGARNAAQITPATAGPLYITSGV